MALCTLKIFRRFDSKLLETEVNAYIETLDNSSPIQVTAYPILNNGNVLEFVCSIVGTKKS